MMRQGKGRDLFFVLMMVIITSTVTIYLININSPKHKAEAAIDEFYTYEQDGAFSDSWAMFHPLMQGKFSKGDYLQDRAHVFMNHFGVTTFEYTLEDTEEIKNWKINKDAEPINVVYKTTVSQVFKGKYGNFTIVQDVFVTMVDGEWKVLWDYNK